MSDTDAIKKKESEMQSEINNKREVLRKIQAPNMRAIDRFVLTRSLFDFYYKF
jgi:hypothetical protein